ncbi:10696_t:CDS:2 [Funneliformis geosporum]|uniref:10696_t:CDS:1 n=1 Tax=Funneliformis geosporum TaxID=1117311 RepID=A0A9W4WHM5_9GLOM|nr:10696_t:CDS:2 [Funneliformis geosporum]
MSGDLCKIQKEIPLEEVEKIIKIDKKELLKSRNEINKLIKEEINLGTLPQKIVLVGFSRGASITLTTGLVFNILWEKQDDVVPYWLIEKSSKILGVKPKSYPYGHDLGEEAFKDAINFSKNVFLEKEINFDDKEA